ncbi:MAG: hypothetical protein Q9219_000885 [cf. Caloplaca sp. 3 TL-2023]
MGVVLATIPFRDVESVLSNAKGTLQDQQQYNTKAHSLKDIKEKLPEIEHTPPDPKQPWVLLGPWLDLVMKSQGLSASDVHKIQLPRVFLNQLLLTNHAALVQGHISNSDAEDLADLFATKTVDGASIDQVLHQKRFFARLDTCSLKDAFVANGVVQNLKDLLTQLATSARASAGIRCLLDCSGSQPIYLYLFRWDDEMRPDLEYRVFCAPGSGRISAISQYRWHAPWHHAGKTIEERDEIAKRVFENANLVHQQIMLHPSMSDDMKRRGFVFDIIEDPFSGNIVRLIELNDFGAMTGCGSCLFNWLKDAELLYGLKENVELRVTA